MAEVKGHAREAKASAIAEAFWLPADDEQRRDPHLPKWLPEEWPS